MERILTLNSHLRVKSRHTEDAWQNIRQILRESFLHQEADTLPRTQQVDSLSIFVVKLLRLNLKHSLNHNISFNSESDFTDTSTDDSDGLDDLTSELLVLDAHILLKLGDKDIESLLEEGNEGFLCLLNS